MSRKKHYNEDPSNLELKNDVWYRRIGTNRVLRHSKELNYAEGWWDIGEYRAGWAFFTINLNLKEIVDPDEITYYNTLAKTRSSFVDYHNFINASYRRKKDLQSIPKEYLEYPLIDKEVFAKIFTETKDDLLFLHKPNKELTLKARDIENVTIKLTKVGSKRTERFVKHVLDFLQGGEADKIERFHKRYVKSIKKQIDILRAKREDLKKELDDLEDEYENSLLNLDLEAIKGDSKLDYYIPYYRQAQINFIKREMALKCKVEEVTKEITLYRRLNSDI